jgi:DNA polymerase III delta subunit
MLYVYFGNDTNTVRKNAFAFLRTLTESDSNVLQITHDTFQEGMITECAEANSLFGGAQIAVIDMMSQDVTAFAYVMQHLNVMAESVNHFIMIEGPLLAPEKKKLQTHARTYEESAMAKKEKFNAFSLTDAFAERNRKSLWLLLTEAWREGLSNEEIIGVLLWQVKMLRLAERTQSAEEAGQKPFVYSKAKRALANFKKGELDDISRALLVIYHDGHLGKCDVGVALERWVLRV